MPYSTNNSCLAKNSDLAMLAIPGDINTAGLLQSTDVNAGLVDSGHIPAPRASLLALS